MKNENLVPKVRFKGFSDPWEQRKLGEIYAKSNEKNKNQFDVSKTISIANMYFKTKGNGAADKSITNYKVLRIGDIAFEGHASKKFSYGRMVMNDIGDGIMSPRFTTLRPIRRQVISFWKVLVHYEPIMKHILARSTKKGTMMNELVVDDFLKNSLRVPNDDEQEKIGNAFGILDSLIAANEDKLEQLKTLKKLMMQKIFSQEWRFKGFTDPWEQRKLGEISKTVTGGGTPNTKNPEYWSGAIPWIQSSNLRKDDLAVSGIDKYVSKKGIKESATKLIDENSIAVVTRVGVGKLAVIPFKYATSQDFLSFSNLLISKWFGAHLLFRVLKHESDRSQGTSIKGITKKALLGLVISVPDNMVEQKKIGSVLNRIDNLIAANEDKLNQLKKLKKYLMQNMFV